jgi:long-chain acyl-CoA synthetase
MGDIFRRLLFHGLQESAKNHPDKTVAVVEGQPFTYGELDTVSSRLAVALVERGVERGDRVAIYMDNTRACIESIYAVSKAGGVFLVINPQTKHDKLSYILNDSDAKILLTDGHLSKVFLPILAKADKLKGVICSGELPKEPAANKIEAFDEVVANTEDIDLDVKVISTDLSALIYTSGTTGNPKGVMQTHQSMVFVTGSLIEYIRLSHDDRILNVLPFAFDYGLYQLLMTVWLGATLVLERSFTYPAQVLKRIEENQVTVFPGVPTIFTMLMSFHKRKKLSLDSVRRVTNTAAALPAETIPTLQEIFPNALIFKMYGQTECKRVAYLEPELLDNYASSVGKAIPGTEIFLLDPYSKPVAPGGDGILHVRGPHVMLGYWKLPQKSADMLKDWKLPGEKILCTHDWFHQDEKGFLYFKGRSDDIIKSRGEKVSPVEVENALHNIEGIREAAVIGVDDELLGQAIKAFVSLEENTDLTGKKIKHICTSKLENFMVPKEVVILDSLPKTPSGKITKKNLS